MSESAGDASQPFALSWRDRLGVGCIRGQLPRGAVLGMDRDKHEHTDVVGMACGSGLRWAVAMLWVPALWDTCGRYRTARHASRAPAAASAGGASFPWCRLALAPDAW